MAASNYTGAASAAVGGAGTAPSGTDQNFDYMFKLLIIGNSSVGKTSFLFRYCDDSFTSAFVSTVGIDFKVKTVFRGDKRVKLQIWVSEFRHYSFALGKKSTIALMRATKQHMKSELIAIVKKRSAVRF
ncbi:unnamed protein product [Anisakis simplex]|uniref:Ras-related protein Rab-3-like n=1 Tax=Anisakis simplex TaxID=6269 RepID=A0A0M3J4P3_ANISI|nr:unnamed protein product [Anisakis simplex]